jgi:ferritin
VLISRELTKAFNAQIGHEFGASMQYVSIAAHFSQRQLKLLSKIFFDQADEEKQHAMKFVQ